jgi:hypothetical protein
MDINPNDLTTPDLLALLPHVFGFEPRNVLAVQTLIGRGLGTAFTLELPGREIDVAVRRLATSAVGAVSSVAGADAVLLAVYTDRRSRGPRGRPFESLQSFVASRLHGSGFHLADSFYVAADGWGSYCCEDPECRLATPAPLADLRRRTRELGEFVKGLDSLG